MKYLLRHLEARSVSLRAGTDCSVAFWRLLLALGSCSKAEFALHAPRRENWLLLWLWAGHSHRSWKWSRNSLASLELPECHRICKVPVCDSPWLRNFHLALLGSRYQSDCRCLCSKFTRDGTEWNCCAVSSLQYGQCLYQCQDSEEQGLAARGLPVHSILRECLPWSWHPLQQLHQRSNYHRAGSRTHPRAKPGPKEYEKSHQPVQP